MEYDKDKVDEATLALLFLVMFDDGARVWKGFDWDTMDRLYQKGFIDDPKGKAKSVIISEEGRLKAEKLFWKLFGSGQLKT